MTITLEIPSGIQGALAREWPDVERKALEAVALEGYRQGALSAGQVGELLGIEFGESEAFLKAHRAFYRLDGEDLNDDLDAARALATP